jgi:ubiquitin C-terminal hydrolase
LANSTASSPWKEQQAADQRQPPEQQQQSEGETSDQEWEQQQVPETALRALDVLRATEDLYDMCKQLGIDVHNGEASGVHVQPRGMINTGNTCFLNSSAQVRPAGAQLS